MGITNTIATISGFLGPVVVGAFTRETVCMILLVCRLTLSCSRREGPSGPFLRGYFPDNFYPLNFFQEGLCVFPARCFQHILTYMSLVYPGYASLCLGVSQQAEHVTLLGTMLRTVLSDGI